MNTLLASATRKIPRIGKRRICFPITSRAYYGRSQLLIRKLHAHPDIELELMLGGSILLDKYSRHIADDIEAGGFAISASLFNVIEGGNHVAMAKTACLTALEFTNGLHAHRSRRRGHLRRPLRAAGDRDGGGVSEQDDRAHRGRRRHRQHRRERPPRHHEAGAHPFRHQRRCRAARAGDGRGPALRLQHRVARRRARVAGRDGDHQRPDQRLRRRPRRRHRHGRS